MESVSGSACDSDRAADTLDESGDKLAKMSLKPNGKNGDDTKKTPDVAGGATLAGDGDKNKLCASGDSGRVLEGVPTGDEKQSHPLLIPAVLRNLFGYLDIKGVKNIRRVCKDWNKEGHAILTRKSFIHFDGNKHKGKGLNDFLKLLAPPAASDSSGAYESYFHKLSLDNINHKPPHKPIFAVHGFSIKALKLHHYTPTGLKVQILKEILVVCPNLDELDIYCPTNDFKTATGKLNLPTLQLRTLKLRAESGVHTQILQQLLESCPNLKQLETNGPKAHKDTDFVKNLMQLVASGKVNLAALEGLSFGKSTPIVKDQDLLTFPQNPWNALASLEVSFGTNFKLLPEKQHSAWAKMLQHVSGTLLRLVCHYFDGPNSLKQDDNSGYLYIPLMEKLNHLEVRTDQNLFFAGPLGATTYLPALKTLIMYCQPLHKETLTFNVHPTLGLDFATVWSLMNGDRVRQGSRCPTLETLQIPCGLTNEGIFNEMATMYPNVKDLRIQNPSEDVIGGIFIKYKKLERLSIRMGKFPPNLDSLLTGLKTEWCTTMALKKKYKFAKPEEVKYKYAGLKDMKHLRYLELRQNYPSSYPTEVSLYNGLMHLTNAVQIDLQGCPFSETGVSELKAALGPCCYVNMEKCRDKPDMDFWARQSP